MNIRFTSNVELEVVTGFDEETDTITDTVTDIIAEGMVADVEVLDNTSDEFLVAQFPDGGVANIPKDCYEVVAELPVAENQVLSSDVLTQMLENAEAAEKEDIENVPLAELAVPPVEEDHGTIVVEIPTVVDENPEVISPAVVITPRIRSYDKDKDADLPFMSQCHNCTSNYLTSGGFVDDGSDRCWCKFCGKDMVS